MPARRPPASAVLSALVVKGSFFIVVRLWFDVMPGLPGFAAAQLLAALGAAAIVFGSVVALRQERLKLLIAYSTLAQIGYLFLMFPLAFSPGSAQLESGGALTGGLLQAISHATAKAAMFMSAGLIYAALGHDRIAGLGGIGRALPMSVLAFALGGVALIGVPPSGAYLAKELLLQAAVETRAMVVGGRDPGGRDLHEQLPGAGARPRAGARGRAGQRCAPPCRAWRKRRRSRSRCARCCSGLFLGKRISRSRTAPVESARPRGARKTLWPILGGGVLAILLGRWGIGWRAYPAGRCSSRSSARLDARPLPWAG